MQIHTTPLPGVLLLQPRIFLDERGRFMESWQEERYAAAGVSGPFVQDNVSVSRRGVVRGLHYQNPTPQGKLVTALSGAIFDVAVDLRRSSPTFGQWYGVELDFASMRQLWIPPGFAHGFQALTEGAVVSYKCTAPYTPAHERTLRWNDRDVAVAWPLPDEAILSAKDAAGPLLRELEGEGVFNFKF